MGIKEKPLFVPELTEVPGGKVPEDTQEAVSYTHLDVYKRQSLLCPVTNCNKTSLLHAMFVFRK